MRRSVLWIWMSLLTFVPLFAQERPIDIQRSKITVHVGKSGLLSGAAHNHTINAPIASGTMRESAPPHIEFTVETVKMMVDQDPRIDAKDQATIQMHMKEMTLEIKRFPEIAFRSVSYWKNLRRGLEGRWRPDFARRHEAGEFDSETNRRFPTRPTPSSNRRILASSRSASVAE